MSNNNNNRPLSPHLSVYKPQITSMLSIMHRLTGVFLYIGALVLALWVYSAFSSQTCFAWMQDVASSWVGIIALFGWSFCLFYHFCNGIRHMFWDMGKGFELKTVTISGVTVVMTAMILTALLWLYSAGVLS